MNANALTFGTPFGGLTVLKIAAFFFDARGNEIVKLPTGLYRALLHTLCQRSSALCKVVVDVYVMKQTCGSE